MSKTINKQSGKYTMFPTSLRMFRLCDRRVNEFRFDEEPTKDDRLSVAPKGVHVTPTDVITGQTSTVKSDVLFPELPREGEVLEHLSVVSDPFASKFEQSKAYDCLRLLDAARLAAVVSEQGVAPAVAATSVTSTASAPSAASTTTTTTTTATAADSAASN